MSIRTDGKHRCDSCGQDVGNGGVRECAIVSDLDPDREGHIRNLEFCRDREDGGKLVKGCSRKLLRPSILNDYEESRVSASEGSEAEAGAAGS